MKQVTITINDEGRLDISWTNCTVFDMIIMERALHNQVDHRMQIGQTVPGEKIQ